MCSLVTSPVLPPRLLHLSLAPPHFCLVESCFSFAGVVDFRDLCKFRKQRFSQHSLSFSKERVHLIECALVSRFMLFVFVCTTHFLPVIFKFETKKGAAFWCSGRCGAPSRAFVHSISQQRVTWPKDHAVM
jgi:hypothetical protein